MKKFKPHSLPPRKNIFIQNGTSGEELDLFNTVKFLLPHTQIFQSDRTILNGREIDIYIPSYKLGIEFDGLYWHSSSSGKTADYHLYKTELAEEKNIRLLHIWSNEWELKRALVVDLIQKALGKAQALDIKQCEIKNLTKASGSNFLNACHLQGDDPSATIYFGIYYINNLIAVLSVKQEEGRWILLRYAERRLIIVKNSILPIVQELLKIQNQEVVCALDRRLYTGAELKEAGFIAYKATPPRKWYTTDYKKMYLEGTSPLREKADVKSVYDCGLMLYKFQQK